MATTTLIADEHVDGYLRDLITLLTQVVDGNLRDKTLTICAIGRSGSALAKVMANLLKGRPLADRVRWIGASRVLESGEIQFDRRTRPESDLRSRLVLVLDSAVHTGSTMAKTCRAVWAHAPASVMSYSLVVKSRSKFVPGGWGLLIGEQDRALFLLKHIPNALLAARRRIPGGNGVVPPTINAGFHLELLDRASLAWPEFRSGEPLLDRITWADRFLRQSHPSHKVYRCYALRAGEAVRGLVGFEIDGLNCHLEEVAVDPGYRGYGFGSALIHWSERAAREAGCTGVSLEAINNTVALYNGLGFQAILDAVGQPNVVKFGDYRLTQMRRSLARGGDWRDR